MAIATMKLFIIKVVDDELSSFALPSHHPMREFISLASANNLAESWLSFTSL
jgi:hypothetical protein